MKEQTAACLDLDRDRGEMRSTWMMTLRAEPHHESYAEDCVLPALRGAAEAAGIVLLREHVFAYVPQGLSVSAFGFGFMITLHTWPELGLATIDVSGPSLSGPSASAQLASTPSASAQPAFAHPAFAHPTFGHSASALEVFGRDFVARLGWWPTEHVRVARLRSGSAHTSRTAPSDGG